MWGTACTGTVQAGTVQALYYRVHTHHSLKSRVSLHREGVHHNQHAKSSTRSGSGSWRPSPKPQNFVEKRRVFKIIIEGVVGRRGKAEDRSPPEVRRSGRRKVEKAVPRKTRGAGERRQVSMSHDSIQ